MNGMFLVNRSERGKCMKKLFAMVLSGLGILAAGAASAACLCFVIDEPEMPKEMIER
jgi:cyclic lactone autoinducer peptide